MEYDLGEPDDGQLDEEKYGFFRRPALSFDDGDDQSSRVSSDAFFDCHGEGKDIENDF